MKRMGLAVVLGVICLASSGCCGFRCPTLCGLFGCRSDSGCGQTYWGDWRACPDTCDQCGNWTGPTNEYVVGRSVKPAVTQEESAPPKADEPTVADGAFEREVPVSAWQPREAKVRRVIRRRR